MEKIKVHVRVRHKPRRSIYLHYSQVLWRGPLQLILWFRKIRYVHLADLRIALLTEKLYEHYQ